MTKYIHNPIKQVEVDAYQIDNQYTISEARSKFPDWLLENSWLLVDSRDMVHGVCISVSGDKNRAIVAHYGNWVVKDEHDRFHVYTNYNFNKAYFKVKSEVQVE